MSKVLTADEAAAILRVTPKTFYTWIKSGKIPVGRKVGKLWLVPEDALMEWLKGDGGNSPTDDVPQQDPQEALAPARPPGPKGKPGSRPRKS